MTPLDPWRRRAGDVADLVLGIALGSDPTLGPGRLVCIDGPAGAGKSTLGTALVEAAAGEGVTATLVHADDLLDGWSGLPTVGRTIADDLLGPLRLGQPGVYRAHDWARDAPGPWVGVAPGDLLCLEGVGSWSAAYAALVGTLVWVELPEPLRRARARARDRDVSWWDGWARDERTLHAREGTREASDVLVHGDEHELTVELR